MYNINKHHFGSLRGLSENTNKKDVFLRIVYAKNVFFLEL